MKRKFLSAAMLLAAVPFLLPAAGMAFSGPGPGFGPGKREGMRPAFSDVKRGDRHLARLSALLGLSEAQREKVGAILAAEEEKAAPLREQMEENRERLHKAVHSGTADEEAIRTLAAGQGKIKADLLVLRAQSWRQIHGVLTPEQQELAKNAPPGFSPGRGKPRGECRD